MLAIALTLDNSAPFIDNFSVVTQGDTSAPTTVPEAGDQNPYGVAVVPRSAGKLIQGSILVSNFNNAGAPPTGNLQGTGSPIVQYLPSDGGYITQLFFTNVLNGNIAGAPADTPVDAGTVARMTLFTPPQGFGKPFILETKILGSGFDGRRLSHEQIGARAARPPASLQSACAPAIDVEQSPFAFARAERWPSGRRHQIANSVQPVLPDQLTPQDPYKSRVFSLLTFCQIISIRIMLDTFGHFSGPRNPDSLRFK